MTSNMTQGLPPGASNSLRLNNTVHPNIGQWRGPIESAAQTTGVPASVIGGVMYQESRGLANVNTTQNQQQGRDAGLMQVNGATLADMRQKHSHEFAGKSGHEENILAGAYYLKENYETFGRWDLARRGYNSGPQAVDRTNAHNINPQYPFGDRDYIRHTDEFIEALSNGEPLRS